MPIYEFHCEGCAKDSEILVRSSSWKGTKCPHCGSTRLSKKFSVFASSGGGPGTASSAGGSCDVGGGGGGGCCGGRCHGH